MHDYYKGSYLDLSFFSQLFYNIHIYTEVPVCKNQTNIINLKYDQIHTKIPQSIYVKSDFQYQTTAFWCCEYGKYNIKLRSCVLFFLTMPHNFHNLYIKINSNILTYFGKTLTVDLIYWPSKAKKRSISSEWNCFSSVIQPITKGGPSKGSGSLLQVIPPNKINQKVTRLTIFGYTSYCRLSFSLLHLIFIGQQSG